MPGDTLVTMQREQFERESELRQEQRVTAQRILEAHQQRHDISLEDLEMVLMA